MHCAGCWESSGKEDCGSEACIPSQKQTKALNNTKFCCCTEDLCNMNHTELPYQTDYEESKDGSTNSTPPCQYYSYFYVNLFYMSVWVKLLFKFDKCFLPSSLLFYIMMILIYSFIINKFLNYVWTVRLK